MTEVRRQILALPLLGGRWAYLDGVWPITEGQWGGMMRVLEAMRPGVIDEIVPLCNRGHPQTPENQYGKDGRRRRCRLCNREDQKRFDLKKWGQRRPHRGMRRVYVPVPRR